MPTLIAGALAVFVLYMLLQLLRTANPALLARAVKIAGGVLCLAAAAFTGLKGELWVAIPIGLFGAGLLGWAPFGGGLAEAQLDRRFPGWRQHTQGNAAGRNDGRATSGKMSDEEAYQILGVKPGAGRDDISKAHRSLMKKLHPDQGGLDVPRGSRQRGQGYSVSHASQLTPERFTLLTVSCFCSLWDAPSPAVARRGRSIPRLTFVVRIS